MIGRITIFCIAASYLVAFGLEVTRIFFKSGVRGALMLAFAGAGLFAHTLFLANRWMTAERAPLSSEFDWYLLVAWTLVLIYFVLVYSHPRNPIGLFCLPLVIGLVLVGDRWASRDTVSAEAEQAMYLWRVTHIGSLLLGTVAVMIGFVSGLMYLLQVYRLKHKLLPREGFELPSLEWLGRIGERAIVWSVILVLCGFATGLMLSKLTYGAVWWSDPAVWSLSVLAAWMVAVGVFNFAYKPARQGQKVAYLTVATFVFLVLTLVALLVGHDHAGRRDATMRSAPQGRQPVARGVSPWTGRPPFFASEGAIQAETCIPRCRPFRASVRDSSDQGLTPLATSCRRFAAVLFAANNAPGGRT
jgi:ABC-type uncharacterized transport system permease subunit